MANNDNVDESRRSFLKKSGYVAGGVVGGGVLGSLIGVNFDGKEEETKSDKTGVPTQERMYFTNQKDFDVLSEATERIFPEDDNGPGAIKLGVPYFIDHQLAGAYGYNTQEYMQGPFHQGTSFQGYQSRLKRNEVYMMGIRILEQKSKESYDSSFTDLEEDQKDKLLKQFEDNEVKMRGVQSSEFFTLLFDATMSGIYSDPLYSGNLDMEGWKMKEYPGHVGSYKDEIEKDEFINLDPTPLKDM